MKTEETKIGEYLEKLSSKAPVPGGGGAAALAGATGASLGLMVCELTRGKKKYAAFETRCAWIEEKLTKLRDEFIELADEDEKVFEPLSKAYGLPKNTPEEMDYRETTLEQCLTDASLTPVKVMEKAVEGLQYLGDLAEEGSRMAVSHIPVAASYMQTALDSAVLNVYINTKMMKNRNKAIELNDYAGKLLLDGRAKGRLTYETVEKGLRPTAGPDDKGERHKGDFS